MNGDECLFCKIAQGEVPSVAIYEDDDVYAFLDIKPVHPGHTLIVPKTHYTNLYELPDEILAKLSRVMRDISIAVKEAVSADGINIEMNNDRAAGQVIFHAHLHVVPRYIDDGLRHWPGTEQNKEGQEDTAQKIIKQLKK